MDKDTLRRIMEEIDKGASEQDGSFTRILSVTLKLEDDGAISAIVNSERRAVFEDYR